MFSDVNVELGDIQPLFTFRTACPEFWIYIILLFLFHGINEMSIFLSQFHINLFWRLIIILVFRKKFFFVFFVIFFCPYFIIHIILDIAPCSQSRLLCGGGDVFCLTWVYSLVKYLSIGLFHRLFHTFVYHRPNPLMAHID